MKKSVSRSFLKVLSVTAAAAAILTLTGCVEEPASTSPANINISISNSNNSTSTSASTSTSTAPSSSASSKTEQEATSTSQNPELPASSSSEASSPASSTPASSEVKTQPGDTAKEPEKFGGCVEAEGVSFRYLGIPEQVEASDGSSIIIAAFLVENKTGKPLNMGQNFSVLEEILYADEEENTVNAESVFSSSSAACFTVWAGNDSQRAACYISANPGEETLTPGNAAEVYLCISEPTSWSSMIVKITIGNTSRYFRLMPSEIGKIINS